MRLKHWYEFFVNIGPRFSFGIDRSCDNHWCFHINVILFGIGIVQEWSGWKLWLGFWPRIPLNEGEYLYKYNKDFRQLQRC